MKRFLCILLLISLLCGCRPQTAVGKQVIVTGIAVNDRFTLSIQAVEALKTAGSLAEQSNNATAVYTANGASVAAALQGFLNEAGKRTYILHNKIIVLGWDFCRQNSVFEALEYFMRNHEGRAPVELLVCRGDAAALLSITTGSDAIPAEYVAEQLREGERYARCVTAQLLDAERAYSGMYDLALPLMSVENGTPKLQGTALFCDGRLVGELSADESVGLALAAGESDYCLYTAGGVSLRLERIRTTVSWDDETHCRVAVSAVARVLEKNTYADAAFLQNAEQQLAAQITTALNTAARCGSDPLGLARRAAAQFSRPQEVTDAWLSQAAFSVSVALAQTDQGFL